MTGNDKLAAGIFQGKVLNELKNLGKSIGKINEHLDKQVTTDTSQDSRINSLEKSRTAIRAIGGTLSTLFTIAIAWLGFK